MPHKHKRDKSKNGSFYDLPPTTLAHPLPVLKAPPNTNSSKAPNSCRSRKPRPNNSLEDDTPRAFQRLMTGRKPPPGLDNGHPPSKKQKRNPTSALATTIANPPNPPPKSFPTLKILPSEPLSSFSARVDAALPVSGLSRSKRMPDPAGIKKRQTKTEKRMQKMQQEWREEAQRRKEREEEARDEAEAESPDEVNADNPQLKPKRKHPKPHQPSRSDEDDPWSSINSKPLSSHSTSSGLIGLHDVVLAPPKLSVPREKMRDKGFSTKAPVGGLRRQGELGEARRKVVEGYRLMMRGRREVGD